MINGNQQNYPPPPPDNEGTGLPVPAVPWALIEAWPIETAGLPRRIATRARQRGYRTVGELRRIPEDEILQWRSVGTTSVQKLHNFFTLCEAISRGQAVLANVHEALALFLDEDQLAVLTARYNLRVPFQPEARLTTLQEIGRLTNRTRERIRQVEEAAFEKLRTNLARTCLEPFYTYFRSILTGLHGTAECSQIAAAADPSLFGDYDPCAVLTLFCALRPGVFSRWHSIFSLLDLSVLAGIEQQLVQILAASPEPLPEKELVERFARSTPTPPPQTIHAAPLVARASRKIKTTIDQHHLLVQHLPHLIAQRMQYMTLPAHFRDITRAINDILIPSSRIGAGMVLRFLNSRAMFFRTDRGLYSLRWSSATAASPQGEPAV